MEIFKKKEVIDYILPSNILSQKNLAPRPKLLYAILYSRCDETGKIEISNAELSKKVGVNETSVSFLLRQLKKHKCIDIEIKRTRDKDMNWRLERRTITLKKFSTERRELLRKK